jgi:hypothetical protein
VIWKNGGKKVFTCQNPSCKKSFTAPLKTVNLQQTPTEPYNACPYCLTKIKINEIPAEIQVEKAQQPKGNHFETKEKLKNKDKSATCNYHPGYLSERNSKEQIPDECLVCKDIVECMLRKMRE